MKSNVETNLASRIGALAGTLTAREKVLAEAMALKPDAAAFESLRKFAESVGVDPSALSRFVSKLGYPTYRDLQLELRSAVTRMLPSPVERVRAKPGKTDIPTLVATALEDDIAQLEYLRTVTKTDQFIQAVRLLAESRGSVYVIGNGWSRSLADLMAHRLALCRPHVESSTSLDMLGNGKLVDFGPQDCAVAIASRRYSARTVDLSRALHSRSVPVIALTDLSTSPLLEYAAVSLIVPTIRSGVFDSPTPSTAAIHLLCTAVASFLHSKIVRRFELLEELSDDMATFQLDGQQRKSQSSR